MQQLWTSYTASSNLLESIIMCVLGGGARRCVPGGLAGGRVNVRREMGHWDDCSSFTPCTARRGQPQYLTSYTCVHIYIH